VHDIDAAIPAPLLSQYYDMEASFKANLRRSMVELDPNDPIVGVEPLFVVTQTVVEQFDVPPGSSWSAPPAPPPFNLLGTVNSVPGVSASVAPSPPPPSPPALPYVVVQNMSVDGAVGKSR
jgi:hypothetical protein